MNIIIILSFLLISFLQLNIMKKKKLWKEFSVYSVIMLTAFIYTLSILYNFELPTVTKVSTYVFMPIVETIEQDSEE